MVKKVSNSSLTWKVLRKPAIKANASQLCEAGRLAWICAKKPNEIPPLYKSVDAYVDSLNKKSIIFEKGFFSKVYKLTDEGKDWMRTRCSMFGLKKNATLWDFMIANMNNIKMR